jgi:hypothetical protein
MCINMILVVGDVATTFYHLLDSLWHRLYQVLKVSGILHPDVPQLQDLILELLQVGRGGAIQPSTAQWLPSCQLQRKV